MSNLVSDKKLFENLHKYAEDFNWTCMAPKCKQECINSHVLQKNGILSQISIDRHLIEVKPTTMWELEKEGTLKFQKIGINGAFTFPAFCSSHDNSIFELIEKEIINFKNYKVQLLFSYRGLCQEIRRKQIVKLFLNQILKRRDEFKVMNVSETFADYKDGLDVGIRNLNYYKAAMEDDLKRNTKSFDFHLRERPYVEICTSAPINVKEPNEKEFATVEDLKRNTFRNKLSTTFVNIFPYNNISKWVIGEHRSHRSSYTSHLLEKEWEQVLTDLLVLRMEYWCMSETFLNKHIKPHMEKIKESYMLNALNFDFDLSTTLNIFK